MVNGKTPMIAALDADSKLCILILMKVLYAMLACQVLEFLYSFARIIADFHTELGILTSFAGVKFVNIDHSNFAVILVTNFVVDTYTIFSKLLTLFSMTSPQAH
jgi:hypothetical protein